MRKTLTSLALGAAITVAPMAAMESATAAPTAHSVVADSSTTNPDGSADTDGDTKDNDDSDKTGLWGLLGLLGLAGLLKRTKHVHEDHDHHRTVARDVPPASGRIHHDEPGRTDLHRTDAHQGDTYRTDLDRDGRTDLNRDGRTDRI